MYDTYINIIFLFGVASLLQGYRMILSGSCLLLRRDIWVLFRNISSFHLLEMIHCMQEFVLTYGDCYVSVLMNKVLKLERKLHFRWRKTFFISHIYKQSGIYTDSHISCLVDHSRYNEASFIHNSCSRLFIPRRRGGQRWEAFFYSQYCVLYLKYPFRAIEVPLGFT